MEIKKLYVECLFILLLSTNAAFSNEDSQPTLNTTYEDPDPHPEYDNSEQTLSTSISEKIPDTPVNPKSNNPKHHHEKHRNPIDSVQTHERRPVYEVVNQPCYSPGCGGYGPHNGKMGNRWQPGRGRYGPYPKYQPRSRGGYGSQEFYPQQGYGPNYGQQYPDYGYGPRGMPVYPPQDRYDRFGGGYGRPPYEDYFLG